MSSQSLHEWDAAYVLGALTPDDRRTFEEHLEGCAECRASVSELAGVPALLSRIPAPEPAPEPAPDSTVTPAAPRASADHSAAARLVPTSAPDTSHTPDAAAHLLPALARRVRRARRRRRWAGAGAGAGATLLAAAALVTAIVVPPRLDGAPPSTSSVVLAQAAPGPLTATVGLTSERWGTALTMTCQYATAALPTGYASSGGRYALYVTDAAGTATRVASWSAWPGATIHASGAIDVNVSQLRTVDVRDATTGAVLLRSTLNSGTH